MQGSHKQRIAHPQRIPTIRIQTVPCLVSMPCKCQIEKGRSIEEKKVKPKWNEMKGMIQPTSLRLHIGEYQRGKGRRWLPAKSGRKEW